MWTWTSAATPKQNNVPPSDRDLSDRDFLEKKAKTKLLRESENQQQQQQQQHKLSLREKK